MLPVLLALVTTNSGGDGKAPREAFERCSSNIANGGKFFVLFYTGSKDWHCRDALFDLGRCFDSNMIN